MLSDLGPVSQVILNYINERAGYIEIFRMINHVRKVTGESHSTKYYRTQLVALALEGRIEGKVQRMGDKIAIRWRRLQEKERKELSLEEEGIITSF